MMAEISRCILGALYSTEQIVSEQEKREKDYKNCIIKLLNSSIDVDKLDYISRDSQVSGFDNIKIKALLRYHVPLFH